MDRYSPVHYVTPGSPPTIVCHGTQGNMVGYSQSELLVATLKKAYFLCYFDPQTGNVVKGAFR